MDLLPLLVYVPQDILDKLGLVVSDGDVEDGVTILIPHHQGRLCLQKHPSNFKMAIITTEMNRLRESGQRFFFDYFVFII